MRDGYCAAALALLLTAVLPGEAVIAQEWGFSAPSGAVLRLERDAALNLTGTLALPAGTGGAHVAVPVSGKNEPGKLILEFSDPSNGLDQVVTYGREMSPDGGYTIWRANKASEGLMEFRAPINVTSEPANSVLRAWQGNPDTVLPVSQFAELLDLHKKAGSRIAIAADSQTPSSLAAQTVAVVTDRPSLAAWQVAASGHGEGITSLQTFRSNYDGVVFTINGSDLLATMHSEQDLLRDFGGVSETYSGPAASMVPVSANADVHPFGVPLSNLFDTFAQENYDISKISKSLDELMKRMQGRKLQCSYGEPGIGRFLISCLHHTSAHMLRGKYLVATLFTFAIGERRNNMRQIFVMADSWAASVESGKQAPGRDRFKYRRDDDRQIEDAHVIALSSLRTELSSMYLGLLGY